MIYTASKTRTAPKVRKKKKKSLTTGQKAAIAALLTAGVILPKFLDARTLSKIK